MSAGHEVHALRVVQDALAGRSGSSIRMRPIASDRVKGSLSGCGLPRLMVRLAWGIGVHQPHLLPACASPIPKLAQVVVLPTPPLLVGDGDDFVGSSYFTSFLFVVFGSGNRKSRHYLS